MEKEKKTVNVQYYASELKQLKEAIILKKGKLRADVPLLQDSAHVHTVQVTVAEPDNCGFELLFTKLKSIYFLDTDPTCMATIF